MVSRPGMLVSLLLAFATQARAETGWLVDLTDSLDLNNYALTAEYYRSQSPYAGVDDFQIIYPLLTEFQSSVDSDSTLYLRDGYGGIRHVSKDGWVFGATGKFQTLGYGSEDSEVFSGMERRNWSLQAGIHLGKRFDRLAFDLFATTDILGEHDGEEYELLVARAFQAGRWELTPQVGVIYQSGKLVNHYFGIRPGEVIAGRRPEYSPGAALTTSARLGSSYRINDRWFLRAAAKIRFLPSEITNSPLVDRDAIWSVSLGIAYDAPAFSAVDDASVKRAGSAVEVIVGGFHVRSRSTIDLQTAVPLPELEDIQQLDETELVFPVDVIWQWGRLHRIDFRAFSLSRSATAQLLEPITVGNTTFGPDEIVATRLRTRVFRIGYGLSIFRDEQKELSVLGGVHVAEIEYGVSGTQDAIAARTTPVLPVIGVRGRVNFSESVSLEANIEAFALDFDNYSGELLDISLSGRYRISELLFTGLGYRFYRQNIRSGDESLFGQYTIDYHGPFAYLGVRF